MPKRKEQIYEQGRPYHVVGTAVDKKGIFESPKDCARFLFQMYAANIGNPAPNLHRVDMQEVAHALLKNESLPQKFVMGEHPSLVEFFSFALTRDHYHFGLVPTMRGGIQKYMQKLNLGFAKYFNLKYGRKGPLFETRFKAIPIKNPKQLEALVKHINIKSVLDVYRPGWEKKGFEKEELAIRFLEEYPYSSFPDLFRNRNSALISESGKKEIKKFFKEDFLNKKNAYTEIFNAYSVGDMGIYEHIFLE